MVEQLEKGTEGGLAIWRFVLRPEAGRAVVVELRGNEIHGSLRDGDHVSVLDTDRAGDVLSPRTVENESLQLNVSVHHQGWIAQAGGKLVITLATALISALVSASVSALIAGGPATVRPRPGWPFPTPSPSNGSSVGAVLFLAGALFVSLWLVWFALWGRRWHGRWRLLGTLGIALGALVAVPIGLAVR